MNRTHRINFWLGDKDLAKLDRKAKEEGLSRSDMIRKLVLETEVIPFPDIDCAAYAKEFRQLGNILNGIVKEYNTTGLLDEEATEAVLAKINERAAHLRDELIEKTVDLEVKRHGDQE